MLSGPGSPQKVSLAFQPGEVVHVKSGGPDLTIISIDNKANVTCCYYNGRTFRKVVLPVTVLKSGPSGRQVG
jgi:uncharacterized protein YodC (DUF2158 family)